MTDLVALGLKADSADLRTATKDTRGFTKAAYEAEAAALAVTKANTRRAAATLAAAKADANASKAQITGAEWALKNAKAIEATAAADLAAVQAKKKVGDASRKTGGALEEMTRRASGASSAMLGLANVLGGALGRLVAMAAAAFSVGGYIRLADAWSDMQSQIGAATKDMAGAPALMERMVDLANASYSPLSQTVGVYARNVGVMRDLGYTAGQTADYTEALNHALVITATRGERAASVQEAMSKAMAVGKLQADGLETVLANGGRVAEALAKELGTTTNGLRSMASEGKITSQVMASALLTSLEELRTEAAEMPATVADGIERIRTGVTFIIGAFDQLTGTSGTLAGALVAIGDAFASTAIWIKNNGDIVAFVFESTIGAAIAATTLFLARYTFGLGAMAVATLRAAVATGTLSGAFTVLKGAIISTGIGVFIVGAGILIGQFLKLSSAVGGFGNAFGLLRDVVVEAFDRLVAKAAQFKAGISAAFIDIYANGVGTFGDLVSAGVEFANRYIGIYRGAMEGIAVVWGALPSILGAAAIGAANAAIRAIEDMLKRAAGAIDSFTGMLAGSWIGQQAGAVGTALAESIDLGEIKNHYADEMAGLGEAVSGAFVEGFQRNTISDPGGYFEGQEARLRGQAEAYREAGRVLGQEAGRPVEAWNKLTTAMASANENGEALSTTLAGPAANGNGGVGGAAKKAAGKADDLRKEIAKLNKEAKEGRTPLEKYRNELEKLNKMRTMGLSDDAYALALEKANKELADGIPIIGDMADAWGAFVSGGFKNFKDFTKTVLGSFKKMLADMVSTAARNKIAFNLGGVSGGVAGGASGSSTGTAAGGSGGMLGQLMGFGSSIMSGAAGLATSLFGAGGGIATAGTYLSSVIGGATGSIAAFGAAIGAIAPIVLGIVSIGKKLFGRTLKDVGIEGEFSSDGFDGNTYKFYKGGMLRSNKTKRTDLDAATERTLGDAFQNMRSSIVTMAESLGMGTKAINKFSYDLKFSTKDMTEDEILAKLQEEMSKAGSEMTKLIFNVNKYKVAGEDALTTLTRLATALSTVNPVMTTLGLNTFKVGAAGANAASKFADLFGGLEAFTSASDFYYQNFYSEEERFKAATRTMSETFGKLGVKTIPATEKAYRKLVERMDKAGNSKGVAALMTLAPAFVELLEMGKSVAEAAAEASAVGKLSEATIRERADLQKQLWTLLGKTGKLRRRELDQLDPTNRAMQKRIWRLERLQAIEKERDDLLKKYQTLVGDTNAIRARELEQLDKSNRKYQRWIYRLEDAQSAVDAATEAFKKSAEAERSRIDDLRSMADSLRGSATSAREAIFDLSEVQRRQAMSQLRTAIQTGKVWDSALEEIADKALDVQTKNFGSQSAYLLAAAQASALVSALADTQDATANTAEARLEKALEKYGLQDETVLGLTAAMTNLDTTLARLARVQSLAAKAFGVNIPAFANGGHHSGGLRMVGERGAELEATGAARYFSATETQRMFQPQSGGDVVVAIVNLEARVVAALETFRREQLQLAMKTEQNTYSAAAVLRREERRHLEEETG